MFYSLDLLTIRRNGKFAKCWLAGTLSSGAFRMRFRSRTILDIDVGETCEELIVHITSHDLEQRFSLRLSALLMFGAARILYYQADILMKYQQGLWKAVRARNISNAKDEVRKKKGGRLPDLPVDPTLLPPPELPEIVPNLRNTVTDPRQITLIEPEGIPQIRGEDLAYFGAITIEEIDRFLQPSELFQDEAESTLIRTFPERVDNDVAHTIETEQKAASIEVPLPSDAESLGTPRKRRLSRFPDVGTPTSKKSRPAIETVDLSEPVEEPESRESILDMIFESLDSILQGKVKAPEKKKKLAIDRQKILVDAAFTRQIHNTNIHTIPMIRNMGSRKKSAAELLAAPTTSQILGWGQVLKLIFKERIFDLQVDIEEAAGRALPQPDRPRGLDDISSLPGVDGSKGGLGKTISTEESHPRPTGISIQHQTREEDLEKLGQPGLVDEIIPDAGISDQVVPLPELNEDSAESLFDISRDLRTIRPTTMRESLGSRRAQDSRSSVRVNLSNESPQTSATSRSELVATKVDVLATLAVLWSQQRTVQFKDICPCISSMRKDAVQVFKILLELHKSKDLKLTQAEPFYPIYIEEYI